MTVSAADRLIDTPREQLAQTSGSEVAAAPGLPATLPPWQIVRERRATFAASPEQDAQRPPAHDQWSNLFLAGDWTDTGLPATIEGAVRSGRRAADLVAQLEISQTLTRADERPQRVRIGGTHRIARHARCSIASRRTGIGCSSSKPMPLSLPNMF